MRSEFSTRVVISLAPIPFVEYEMCAVQLLLRLQLGRIASKTEVESNRLIFTSAKKHL